MVFQFFKYQKTTVIISTVILMSIIIYPITHFIDMVLEIDVVEFVELKDTKDTNGEGEYSEFEENSFEKKNPTEDSLYWSIFFDLCSLPIRLIPLQLQDSVVMDITLPPPEPLV